MTMNEIIPDSTIGSHRTGRLDGITVDKIEAVLGFSPNVKDDPDKVRYSWGFRVNGYACAIWDYRGSHEFNTFSTFGPSSVLHALFPDHYVATVIGA